MPEGALLLAGVSTPWLANAQGGVLHPRREEATTGHSERDDGEGLRRVQEDREVRGAPPAQL